MAKSRDAFRTIGEVAEEMDLPAHVLRFWESKFTQIRPVKRAGGRRYYRPDDVALLAGIKVLLHDQGMTIKSVQGLLREAGTAHVMDLGTRPADTADSPETAAALPGEADAPRPSAADPAPVPPEATPSATGGAPAPRTPAPESPAANILPFAPDPAAPRPAPPPAAPVDQPGLFDDSALPAARALAFVARKDPARLRRRARALRPLVERLEALHDALRD